MVVPEGAKNLGRQADPAHMAIPPDQTRKDFVLPRRERDPQPFGITWLDTILLGGLGPGEVLLFLGPTGHGKTTLATQMAFARASQDQHAVYITYDQKLEGDLYNRFWSMMTGVGRRELEGPGVAGMPIEVQERFQAWREAHGRYSHLYDLSGRDPGRGDISDVEDIIMIETGEGRPPRVIIVDYIQLAVDKAINSGLGSSLDLADSMDTYAREFAGICRTRGIQGVLIQQLDVAHQRSTSIDLDHRMGQWVHHARHALHTCPGHRAAYPGCPRDCRQQ